MKRNITILCIFILFSSISQCHKTEEPTYPVVTETIDGIKVVTNPDYPRDGKTYDLLEEEISIGPADGPEEYLLNQPRDVKASEDGTIFILDAGDNCIKVYGRDGQYLRTIGQKGQGPGDLGFLFYMALSSDGKIFVMDSVNRRVSVFNMIGEYLTGFPFKGFHQDIETDGLNRLYYVKRFTKIHPEELPVTDDLNEIEAVVQIYRNEADGKDLFLMGEYEGEIERMKRTDSGGVMTTGSEYKIVWAVNNDGMLYEGFNKDYKINVFDPKGQMIFTFRREHGPVTQVIEGKDQVRKRKMPAYDSRIGWVFDDENNLWISTFSENVKEVVYDVFSPEGIYLKQVILMQRICDIRGGKFYGIVSTEEGFMAVKRYRLKESLIP